MIYRVELQRRYGAGYRRATETRLIEAIDAADLQSKCRDMRVRVLGTSLAPLHTCCVCGRTAPWDDNWMWFGSYKDIDDGKTVRKFCSAPCRQPGKSRMPAPADANDG